MSFPTRVYTHTHTRAHSSTNGTQEHSFLKRPVVALPESRVFLKNLRLVRPCECAGQWPTAPAPTPTRTQSASHAADVEARTPARAASPVLRTQPLRRAVERLGSDPIYLFRWEQVADQLVKDGFPGRTEKSVRNRYLRLTRKPSIHAPEKKNRCRFCGEYTRGHSCKGMKPTPTDECVSSKSPVC